MKLILAQVYNRMTKRHGAIHPSCRPCFDGTGRRWAKDKTLALRLDEVIEPDAKPHVQYNPFLCVYCSKRGLIEMGKPEVEMTDNKLRIAFCVCCRGGGRRSGTLYAEGNVQMDDGELFSRLDQLVTSDVVKIEFAER